MELSTIGKAYMNRQNSKWNFLLFMLPVVIAVAVVLITQVLRLLGWLK